MGICWLFEVLGGLIAVRIALNVWPMQLGNRDLSGEIAKVNIVAELLGRK